MTIKELTKLTQVPGIGTTVSEKLIEHFNGEEKALEALANTNISEISEIDGIGEKMATRLVRSYHYTKTGEDLSQFLRTPDSINIYDKIVDIIQEHGSTTFAKAKAVLITPLPTDKVEIIRERQEFAINSHKLAKHLIDKLNIIDAELRKIGPIKNTAKSVDIGARAIFTTNDRIFKKLQNEVKEHCLLIYLDNLTEFKEEATAYDEVILISDYTVEENVESFVIIPEEAADDTTRFLPELTLALFADNYQKIQAMLNLLELIEIPAELPFSQYIKDLEKEKIQEFKKYFNRIKETGEVEESIDDELNRLSYALTNIDEVLSETEIKINEILANHLRKSSVELKGERLLQLLKQQDEYGKPQDVREFLDDSIYEFIEELLLKEEQNIIEALNLKPETELVEDIFPRQITVPIEIDYDRKDLLLKFLRKKFKTRSIENKIEIAQKLEKYQDMCFKTVRELLSLDYALMIGKFGLHYGLKSPKLTTAGKGIICNQTYNLFLLKEFLNRNKKPDPISYELGQLGELPERVTLLSGANSGGKTTLLNMVAQLVILAQMGLEIPAEKNMTIGLFDEIYYYKKSSGNLDAGAFESTLKVLSNMILSTERSRIVLADEMESISEPGASARVISAFLDLLQEEPNSCGIFVSHLAQQIRNVCQKDIRIDGIEAKGLDQDLQLIVNRSPLYHHYARSTPQLIVERLHALSHGKEKDIYAEILKRLKNQ